MNTNFLSAAALLTLLVLGWLAWPLLRRAKAGAQASRQALNSAVYRDQLAELERDRVAGTLAEADCEQARTELQHRLLQDAAEVETVSGMAIPAAPAKMTLLLLAILLPLGAALLYAKLGHPEAMELQVKAPHEVTSAQIEEMVTKLAARLEKNPNDPQGWVMLARSYKAMGRFEEADKAYEKIAGTFAEEPGFLAEYADLLAVRQNGDLEGKPLELVKRALELDPNYQMALSLAGTAAYNRKDWAEAQRYWQTLLSLLPPESEEVKSLTATLAEVREKGGLGPMPVAKAGSAGDVGKAVSGEVKLAPALASQVQPGDTLFIYARAAEGPRMPLAAMRVSAANLPLSFKLDDTLAINPAMNISSAPQIKVEARISKSGQATPQKGDLLGESKIVKPGAKDVRILIDRGVP